MNQQNIGKYLKKLRKEKKITQEQLAEMLSVSNRTVSRWETGTNLPDLSILIELSEYYGVSINDILCAERNDNMDNELKETLQNVADYDELKKKKAQEAGNLAFCVTVFACAISISLQMILSGDLHLVMGETFMLLVGGIFHFTPLIRNGAWDTGAKNTKKTTLIISTTCSLVFSVVLLLILRNKAEISKVVWMTLLFYIVISIVSYIFLRIMSRLSERFDKKNTI